MTTAFRAMLDVARRVGPAIEETVTSTTPSTTVNADSAAGQKVLNVAATTGFTTGNTVWINDGGVREETKVIDTVQAGVSLTMTVNLTYTHTAAQADRVNGPLATLACSRLADIPDASVDDTFNRGTVFLVTDVAGLSAAPEGETAKITDYAGSIGTVYVTSGDFSVPPAIGDAFALTKIPRYELFQALNSALQDLGPVPSEGVSLTTASATRSYTIPAAAKADLRQVWIARRTSEPYDWEELYHWMVRDNTSTYDLLFPYQPESGYKLRLVYVAAHALLDADADTIQAVVPDDYLIWRAAYHHYRLRLHYPGKDEKRWTGLMNEAAEYAAQALRRHPIRLPQKTARMWWTPEQSTEVTSPITTEDVPTA